MERIFSDFLNGEGIAVQISSFIEKHGDKILKKKDGKKTYAMLMCGKKVDVYHATVEVRKKNSDIISQMIVFFTKDVFDPNNIVIIRDDRIRFEENSFAIIRGNKEIERFSVE